ncbi:hypothetical protein Hanom_Chr10g00909091 [Helianthus anomalus]
MAPTAGSLTLLSFLSLLDLFPFPSEISSATRRPSLTTTRQWWWSVLIIGGGGGGSSAGGCYRKGEPGVWVSWPTRITTGSRPFNRLRSCVAPE